VVIHVIAEQPSVDGSKTTPGYMAGADELIPADIVAALAKSATVHDSAGGAVGGDLCADLR
jgi:hypothetical protein